MSTWKAADALLVPVFCFSPIFTCFAYSPLLGKTKRGEDDLEITLQKLALDPHQNVNVEVPAGWLMERELV